MREKQQEKEQQNADNQHRINAPTNQQKAEMELEALEAQFKADSAPILEQINAVGLQASSLLDLSEGSPKPNKEAIRILVSNMAADHPANVREWIARACAHRSARPFLQEIAALAKTEAEDRVRFAMLLAIGAAASKGDSGFLLQLLGDRTLGVDRIALIPKIARLLGPETRSVLQPFSNDPHLCEEIQATLHKRLKE